MFFWPCIMNWLYNNYQLWSIDYYLFIKYYSLLHVSSLKCSSSGGYSCTHAAYGTVTLYQSSWWPVGKQLEWDLECSLMLHVYNCILLKMSIWGLKHVEENSILWINNNQCIKVGNYYIDSFSSWNSGYKYQPTASCMTVIFQLYWNKYKL